MPKHFTTAALLTALALGGSVSLAAAQDAAQSRPSQGPADARAQDAADDGPPTADVPAADDENDGDLFAQPDGGDGDNAPPAVVEAEDLVLGETFEIEGDRAIFRFHADDAGMLTLLTFVPANDARVRLTLEDAEGNDIPGAFLNDANGPGGGFGARIVVDEFGNQAGTLPGLSYLTLPLPEAGDYRIEFTIDGDPEGAVQVGGSWVEFEQLNAEAQAPPPPVIPVAPPPPPPPLDPTEIAVELATGEALELETEEGTGWVRVVADEPGTLVIASRAQGTDVTLTAFADGQFADARYSVNRNRQGQRGNEAMMFHADAGSVWFIRVTSNNNTPVPVRAVLIPDDLEPAPDE